MIRQLLLYTLLLLVVQTTTATPHDLQAWADWLLEADESRQCASQYSHQDHRLCLWPGTLQLDFASTSGSFQQQVETQGPSLIPLPGDAEHWPLEVRLEQMPVPVLRRDDRPFIAVESAGSYRISGRFQWDKIPQEFSLPASTGLLAIVYLGKSVPHPQFSQGRISFRAQQIEQSPDSDNRVADSLNLQVFRRLDDRIPFQIDSELRLSVTGKLREVDFGPVLLAEAKLAAIDAPIPVRIDANGRLLAQVRSGQWTIRWTSFITGPVDRLARPEAGADWPQQEIWAFQRHPNVRSVTLSGLQSIDVRQVNQFPRDWRNLETYLVQPEQSLLIQTDSRGEVKAEPLLTVNREVWLDFDGSGYRVKDRISGTARGGTRLEALADNQLGRVDINGTPRFITVNEATGQHGIELKENRIDLEAEGRVPDGDISALGWDLAAQSLQVKLNAPPGYYLLHASGPDQVSGSWVARWTLMDLFLVLVIAIAFTHLYGRVLGALVLLTLALAYHEAQMPAVAWLPLLAFAAIARYLPEGRLQRLAARMKWVTAILLLAAILPFSVNQMRAALYPQLDPQHYRIVDSFNEIERQQQSLKRARQPTTMPQAAVEQSWEGMPLLEQADNVQASGLAKLESMNQGYAKKRIDRIDSSVRVQSGVGLPNWQGRNYQLRWNGGITPDQQMELLWVDRTLVRLLRAFVALALLVMLAVVVSDGLDQLKRKAGNLWQRLRPGASAQAGLLLVLLVLAGWLPPQAALSGEMPPKYLLDELHERLIRADRCFPDCAQVESMQVDLARDRIQFALRVHVLRDAIALPIPGSLGHWLPERVSLEAEPGQSVPVFRASDDSLWIALDRGVHGLQLEGALDASQPKLSIPVPLDPGYVAAIHNRDDYWRENAVHRNKLQGGQLSLSRQAVQAHSAEAVLPPLGSSDIAGGIQVERRLFVDQEIEVETQVRRLGDSRFGIHARVPLLPGERLLTEQLESNADGVQVYLAPGQAQLDYSSRIDLSERLTLTAATPSTSPYLLEQWQVSYSPAWTAVYSGLEPIRTGADGQWWSQTWTPYPGESLNLGFAKPQGAEGRVITIDQAELQLQPGDRDTQLELRLAFRSTQNERMSIALPPESRLLEFTLDGRRVGAEIIGERLSFDSTFGAHKAVLKLAIPSASKALIQTPPLSLNRPFVNERIRVNLPRDRWLVWVAGPMIGPAILYYGVMIIAAVAAFGVSRMQLPGLRGRDLFLLTLGFSTVSFIPLLVLVGWFWWLKYRANLEVESCRRWRFNLMQVLLALYTLVVIGAMIGSMKTGLLGLPEMQVSGNGSTAYALKWYNDASEGAFSDIRVVSVPLWVYRVLMLLWSLWLAHAAIRWIKQAWFAYSQGGVVHPGAKSRPDEEPQA